MGCVDKAVSRVQGFGAWLAVIRLCRGPGLGKVRQTEDKASSASFKVGSGMTCDGLGSW